MKRWLRRDAQFGHLYQNKNTVNEMEKFRGKYRIKTTRLQSWDYSNNGFYFVTICTKNRFPYFGNIVMETPKLGVSTAKMQLSEIGKIAQKYWIEIPEHFPFVELDKFIIMPNHFHGIIIIDKPNGGIDIDVETPDSGVSTTNTIKKWKSGSLGVIINQFKRKCTIESRIIDPDFGWQSRYYDHIIRDDKSLYKIQNYIINNPAKWKDDDYFTVEKPDLNVSNNEYTL